MSEWGFFPFGRPNSVRPARSVDKPEAVIIRSYPGAWHVDWRPPEELVEARSLPLKSLAVDVEPPPFADDSDFTARLALWKEEVGFIEGKHGTIAPDSPAKNGASREKIVRRYLAPLGIAAARALFTNIHPVYLRRGAKSARNLNDEALDEYNRLAQRMGLVESSIPERVPPGKLPALAAARFGEQLVAELSASGAPLIITLGEPVWRALVAIPSLCARPPLASFSRLRGHSYGAKGALTVNGRTVIWLPLIQPGVLQRAQAAGPAPEPLPPDCWEACHLRWAGGLEENRAAKRAARRARNTRKARELVVPEGSEYRLTIARARLVELRGRGSVLEVVFEAADDPHRGTIARGQFPLAGPGLPVLVTAALGERLSSCDDGLASRLAGSKIVADVIHGGTGGHSLALVRNIRPATPAALGDGPRRIEDASSLTLALE